MNSMYLEGTEVNSFSLNNPKMVNNNKSGILYLQRIMMIMLGKWHYPWKNQTVHKMYKFYYIFMDFYYLIFTQNLLLNAIMKWQCKEISFKLAVLYAHHTNAAIVAFISKGVHMKKAISYILDYEKSINLNKDALLKETYSKYSNLNVKLGTFVMIGPTAVGAVLAYILYIWLSLLGADDERCPMTKWLFYQVSYPFNIDEYRSVGVICDLIQCVFALSIHVYNKMINVTLATFQLGQIKVLQAMIKELDKNARKLQEREGISLHESVEIMVHTCIRQHQTILRYMDLLHKATKQIILIEFFSSSTDLAVFLIETIVAHTIQEAIVSFTIFFIIIFQTLPFFWLSNEIFLESQSISDIIFYETNWKNYSSSVQRKLLIMMLRCRKPTVFRSTGVGTMTLDTYKKIVKSCYSIVTFFRSAYY